MFSVILLIIGVGCLSIVYWPDTEDPYPEWDFNKNELYKN